MADMEFDLGEALGGYEQAKADRDFYLNMIDMGRTNKGAFMASPIAAYLYGVSNVKMANMRAKAQNIEDQRQAEKDAIDATERAQKRGENIDNQIVTLVKGARDGSIPASVAATMLGPLMKEKGINLKQFDADRSVLIGNEPGDTEDFEWDLSEKENSLEAGRNKRAEERIAWEREKQGRGIQGQKEVAGYKASLKEEGSGKSGSAGAKEVSVTDFERLNPKVTSFLKNDFSLEEPTESELIKYGQGIKSLPERYRELAYNNLLNAMDRMGYDPEKQKELLRRIQEQEVESDTSSLDVFFK